LHLRIIVPSRRPQEALLRAVEIENWALQVIDRVQRGAPIEDSRVELKAKWVDSPNHVARQIAGHCNANAGDDVLWIIGIDEKNGVTGVEPRDMAKWWPQVSAQFDGRPPSVQDVILTSGNLLVVALLFRTDRVPFVVRNAAHGRQGGGGGSVEWEVPWREGTSVRSATHSDLVRLLVPAVNLPKLQPHGGHAELHTLSPPPADDVRENRMLNATIRVYAEISLGAAMVLPDHLAFGRYSIPARSLSGDLEEVKLHAGSWRRGSFGNRAGVDILPTHTIHQGDSQILVEGPGFFRFGCRTKVPNIETEEDWVGVGPLQLLLGVRPVGGDRETTVQVVLQPDFVPASRSNSRPGYRWLASKLDNEDA
jgi:hypothetical protein